MISMQKKGMSLGDAPGLIITLVLIGVIGAVGLVILGQMGDNTSLSAAGQEAINASEEAIGAFFSLLPTLGIIFIAVLLLGAVALLGFWGFRRMQ